MFSFYVSRVRYQTGNGRVVGGRGRLHALLSLGARSAFRDSMGVLVNRGLISPSLVRARRLAGNDFRVVYGGFRLVLLVLVHGMGAVTCSVVTSNRGAMSFPRDRASFFRGVDHYATTGVVIGNRGNERVRLPIRGLRFRMRSCQAGQISSTMVHDVLIMVQVLTRRHLAILFRGSLLFLEQRASAVLIVCGRIVRVRILVTYDCNALTPIVLLAMTFSRVLLVRGTGLLSYFRIRARTRTRANERDQVLQASRTRFVVSLPRQRSLGRFIVPTRVQRTTSNSTDNGQYDNYGVFLYGSQGRRTLRPLFQGLRVYVCGDRVVFHRLWSAICEQGRTRVNLVVRGCRVIVLYNVFFRVISCFEVQALVVCRSRAV